MLKMIFFDEDPDEVLKEEDIRESTGTKNSGEIERVDFRDSEEVNIDFLFFFSFCSILEICSSVASSKLMDVKYLNDMTAKYQLCR